MTKFHSALAVATVALSPSCSTALSLLPQRGPAHRVVIGRAPSPPIGGGLFGNKRSSSRSGRTQQWMLPSSFRRANNFLGSLNFATIEKEPFFAADDADADDDDDDTEDGKSWPVKPPTPPEKPPAPPPPLKYVLPSEPTIAANNLSLDFLDPIVNPTIAKNVPRNVIRGAAINGAFLTLLASFLLFGPLSVLPLPSLSTLVVAASIGIITAYISITEGDAGDFVRSVGGVTMEVTDSVLGKVDAVMGEREVGKVANALLVKPLGVEERRVGVEKEKSVSKETSAAKVDSMPLITEGMTAEEALEVRNARLDAADDASGKQSLTTEKVVLSSVDYDAPARLAFQASGLSENNFDAFKVKYLEKASAMVGKKFQNAMQAEKEEARAKVAAEEENKAQLKAEEEEAARAKAMVAAVAEEEAQARAEEEARFHAAAKEEARLLAEEEEARARAEEKARLLQAEEEAKAKAAAEEEDARLKAEEEAARARAEEEARDKAAAAEEEARLKAAAEEEARLQAEEEKARAAAEETRAQAEEEVRLEKVAAAEEARLKAEEEKARLAAELAARQLEEQAEAAREAVRLMEEQEALMDDDDDEEDELDDEDWEASVRLANELQGVDSSESGEGDVIGGDVMDDIGDELLQNEIDNLSQEEEDALGKAAREAVRKYEEDMMMKKGEKKAVRSAWDDEMVAPPSAPSPVAEAADLGEDVIDGSEEAAAQVEAATDYSKMTVVELKDALRSKGLKVSGKKSDLIERLESS